MKKSILLYIGLFFSMVLLANQHEKLIAEMPVDGLTAKIVSLDDIQVQKTKPLAVIEFESKKKNFLKEKNVPNIHKLNQQTPIIEKYSLDSMVHSYHSDNTWVLEEKEIYEYNQKGQITLGLSMNYDEDTNSWNNYYRTIMNYNEDGLVILIQQDTWDAEKERWGLNYLINYDYDANGNIILEEAYYEELDEQNGEYQLHGYYKSTYEFDENQHQTLNVYYSWSIESEEWVPVIKSETLYDEAHIQLVRADYFWLTSENKWIGSEKTVTYPIPVFPFISDNKTYHWDYTTDNWYLIHETAYEVNGSIEDVEVIKTTANISYATGKMEFEEKVVLQNFVSENFYEFNEMFEYSHHYLWDSLTEEWVNDRKTHSQYTDDKLILKEQNQYQWGALNGTTQWILVRELNTYIDDNGLLLVRDRTSWKYDADNHTYYAYYIAREYFSYEEGMSVPASVVTHILNSSTNQWEPVTTVFLEYDDQERVLHQYNYEYNAIADTWKHYASLIYEYNADGSKALHEQQNYIASIDEFVRYIVSMHYIDEYGDVTLQAEGRYHTGLNETYWIYHYEKEFNENRALTMESSLTSYVTTDSSGSGYELIVDAEKYETSYNSEGYKTSYIESFYDKDAKEFVQEEKINLFYHDGIPGAFDYEIYYEKDLDANQWNPIEKRELSSNFSIVRDDLVLPFADNSDHEIESYFNYMPDEMLLYGWDDSEQEWIVGNKSKLYYTLNEYTATESIKNDEIKIYPNPATDYVIMDIAGKASIRLYDMHGRILHEKQTDNQATINISSYAPGIYFYSVEKNGEVRSGKVMKR